ncbi:hypothetical protein JW824_05105 [bacterium]|nr:hypothetical protein [bacterium]RQV96731.1 MAG: hypothetical protein EH221_04560 [bacterium]
MPIYEETYTSWEGHLKSRPRTWWVIARTGVRLLWKKWMIVLLLFGTIPFLVRVVQIYLMSRFGNQASIAQALQGLKIDPEFFINFINGQNFLLMLVLILAGAGLVVNDRRFNALPIYFSKPVNFWDYTIGKLLIVAFYGSLITLIPGLLLFLIQVLLTTDATFLQQYLWIPASLIGFVFIKLVVLGGFILTLSSISKSTRTTAILFFALLTFPEIFRAILSQVPETGIISLNADLGQIGAFLFGLELPYAFSIWLTLCTMAGVIILCYFVLRKKIRSTEVVK